MHQNKTVIALLMGLFISAHSYSQEVLTIEEAVKTALENNFNIRLAKNNLSIDTQNKALANAGILPTIDASFSDVNNRQNVTQIQQNGEQRSLDWNKSLNINYGVALNWTLFDGLSMFARYDQLKELEKLGEVELKQAVLTNVGDVYATYYDLVQIQQQLAALDTAIVISKQRVETAKNRYTIGKVSKLEVLNAEVDLNTDITAQLAQQELYANTKIRLNELIARKIDIDFKVSDDITVDNNLLLDKLLSLASDQNPQLQAQVINKRIAQLQKKITVANRMPRVNFTTGYNWGRSENPAGFIVQSDFDGLNYGITATLPIFNGLLQSRNEKIAKLQIENSELAIQQQQLTLEAQLSTTYQTYLTNLRLIELEAKNTEIAKENLDITLEKFKIGTIPTIEFRAAQVNYVNAKVRYTGAQYQAKLSEIALKELAGSLTL